VLPLVVPAAGAIVPLGLTAVVLSFVGAAIVESVVEPVTVEVAVGLISVTAAPSRS
jgi:hypothetical protein